MKIFIRELTQISTPTTNNSFLKRYLSNFKWSQILSNLSEKIVNVILLSIFFWIIKRIGKIIINKIFFKRESHESLKSSTKRTSTLHSLAYNTFQYGLGFFWIYSVLSIIGIPVGTLITGAGIFSLAIGLGAQGFVSDIVSGFFIIFEKQIDVGEYVKINHIEGTVTSIGLRTTQITSYDGTLNFIPNRNITTIANLSRNNMVAIIHVKIKPSTPISQALAVIKRVNHKKSSQEPKIIGSPDIRGIINLSDGSPAIEVYITTQNGAQFKIQRDFLGSYLEALNQAGIKLPNDSLTAVGPPKSN